MGIKLNEEQQEIYDNIIEILNDSSKIESFISLTASAGCGKTVLISVIAEYLIKNKKVRVCTPTHKSLAVLQSKLDHIKSDNLELSTIHSFLKLKLKENHSKGIQELVSDAFGIGDKNNLGKVDVLIIDESSMISNALFSYIKASVKSKAVRYVLLVGDHLQLLPIDNNSNPDDTISKIEVDYQFKLNNIVRQAEGNPIIEAAQEIRHLLEKRDFSVPPSNLLNTLPSVNNIKEFIKTYLEDKRDCYGEKFLISFTNAVVNQYNEGIRKEIRGNVEEFVDGEHIIFNEAYAPMQDVEYKNNQEVSIVSCDLRYHHEYKINFWSIQTDHSQIVVNVVAKDSIAYFNSVLRTLASEANSAMDRKEKSNIWRKYFSIKKQFANVSYGYASTTTKSQGSTFQKCYFDIRDLERFYHIDPELVYRLLYVGITRASDEVLLLR